MGDFSQELSHSIYSQEQREQHRAYELAKNSRKPMAAQSTNAATRGIVNGVLGSPLTDADLSALQFNMGSLFFPLFPLVGEYWFIFVTILLVISMVKVAVNGIVRTYTLYMERGCGCWMFTIVSSTLFSVARTPMSLVRTAVRSILSRNAQPPGAPRRPGTLMERIQALLRRPDTEGPGDVAMAAFGGNGGPDGPGGGPGPGPAGGGILRKPKKAAKGYRELRQEAEAVDNAGQVAGGDLEGACRWPEGRPIAPEDGISPASPKISFSFTE
jgi:hypothetical protein